MKKMHVLKPNNNREPAESGNVFNQLAFRYLPFWPLFLALVLLGLAISYVFLKYATPVYESSAAIMIKDEKKGSEESKMSQSFNLFGTTNIVENEIEIIHSNAVLMEAVKDLKLYAPVTEDDGWFDNSGYLSCPITVEAQSTDSMGGVAKAYFTFSAADSSVTVGSAKYRVGQWVTSPWGIIRFNKNPLYQPSATSGKFYFSLINVNAVAKGLAGSLVVNSPSKTSTVVNLKLKDAIPQRAEKILNDIIRIYTNDAVADKNSLAAKTLEFVTNRLNTVSGELGKLESNIQDYRDEKGVVDISAQGKMYLDNVGKNDQQLSEVNVQLAVLDQVKKYAEGGKNNEAGLVVPSTMGISDPQLSQMLESLAQAQSKYESLRKTVGENNPVLTSVKANIDNLRPKIIENINSQRNNLEVTKNSLTSNSNKFSSMLSTVPQKERQLVQVSREQNIKNSTYSFLLQKKEEAAFSMNSAVADSRVIDKATSSPDPVSPKRPIILLMFPLVGLGLGIGIVSLKGAMNGKIMFRSEIEHITDFPVIGELSFDQSKNPLVMASPERTFITEQFRQLRVAVALGYLGNLPNSNRIAVTSSVEGEGKSFVAANIAISLALAGKKVALVDLDLHQPKLSEMFNIDNEHGVTEYLLGTKEADQIIKKIPSISHNLYLISSGTLPPNPSEFILNDKVEKLLNYLTKSFDVLILDTPPVVPVSDTFVIGQFCSAILYVVRHNYTPKVHVRMLDDSMAQNNIKNVAVIFNGVKKRGFGKGYGHGYGYGYGYNSGYGYGHQKGREKKKII